MKRVFFIDFDGTITKKDTCEAMVETFAAAGWEEINLQWERREISTEECANRTFALFRANLEDLNELLDTIEIDAYFKEFIEYCLTRGYPHYILSDGYDYIIDYILKKYDLQLDYYANRLVYKDGFSIVCPHHNPACGTCGTCKTTLLAKLKPTDCRAVYIGDGTSDLCPATMSDLVFAKGRLLEYCREKGIQAQPFTDFRDILIWLKQTEA
ncbi:MAG: MtnX-like HAD-IB family phosphatase [Clostridia bacterium]|nr:MtnX-like HAD-IB family phosphatase [Clostridia bacterium]